MTQSGFTDTVPTKVREHDLDMRQSQREQWMLEVAAMRKRLPAGTDQQGRYPTRDHKMDFKDSDIDHYTDDGLQLLVVIMLASASLIAVGVIALIARLT